jgi:alpha-ketoglutarate-dependent taurine dioxygenase
MEYTITRLTPRTGAEVRGIDLNGVIDDETRAALNRALVEPWRRHPIRQHA